MLKTDFADRGMQWVQLPLDRQEVPSTSTSLARARAPGPPDKVNRLL